MRFWTWVPLFILLQFSLCGQEERPSGELEIVAEDASAVAILDAVVELDGSQSGLATPAIVAVRAEVTHRVSLSKSGWRFTPASREVELGDGEAATLVFTGAPAPPGHLTVHAVDAEGADVPGVTVLLDGEAQPGTAPLTLDVESNVPATVSVSHPDWVFTPAEISVLLDEDESDGVTFTGEQLLRHLVIVEDFANTGCVPCPEADEAMWAAVGLASGAALPLAWHPNFPQANDPFFLYNPALGHYAYGTARNAFYNIVQLPNVRVDGVAVGTPSSPDEILAAIEARLSLEPALQLSVARSQDGGDVTVAAEGRVLSEVPDGNWRLYLVLIETLVHFEASNGQTEFRNTVRHAGGEETAPAGTLGEPVTLGLGAEFSAQATFTPDFGQVVAENLRAVAFVQNTDTFEILDAVVEVTGGP